MHSERRVNYGCPLSKDSSALLFTFTCEFIITQHLTNHGGSGRFTPVQLFNKRFMPVHASSCQFMPVQLFRQTKTVHKLASDQELETRQEPLPVQLFNKRFMPVHASSCQFMPVQLFRQTKTVHKLASDQELETRQEPLDAIALQ